MLYAIVRYTLAYQLDLTLHTKMYDCNDDMGKKCMYCLRL